MFCVTLDGGHVQISGRCSFLSFWNISSWSTEITSTYLSTYLVPKSPYLVPRSRLWVLGDPCLHRRLQPHHYVSDPVILLLRIFFQFVFIMDVWCRFNWVKTENGKKPWCNHACPGQIPVNSSDHSVKQMLVLHSATIECQLYAGHRFGAQGAAVDTVDQSPCLLRVSILEHNLYSCLLHYGTGYTMALDKRAGAAVYMD